MRRSGDERQRECRDTPVRDRDHDVFSNILLFIFVSPCDEVI